MAGMREQPGLLHETVFFTLSLCRLTPILMTFSLVLLW